MDPLRDSAYGPTACRPKKGTVMGGLGTYRNITGEKSYKLRRLAVALPASVLAMSLAACQAPADLNNSSTKAQAHPAASSAPATALAVLNKSDAEIVGLGDRDLAAALGAPSHVRHDDPATVWQYSANDCVLDFYLYKADAGLQVAYVEARDRKARNEKTQSCVHSLLQPNEASLQKTADAAAN